MRGYRSGVVRPHPGAAVEAVVPEGEAAPSLDRRRRRSSVPSIGLYGGRRPSANRSTRPRNPPARSASDRLGGGGAVAHNDAVEAAGHPADARRAAVTWSMAARAGDRTTSTSRCGDAGREARDSRRLLPLAAMNVVRTSRARLLVLLTSLALLLLLLVPAVAAAALKDRIASTLSRHGMAGSGTSVAVFDLTAKRSVYQLRQDVLRLPASNEKLVTSATALAALDGGVPLQHAALHRRAGAGRGRRRPRRRLPPRPRRPDALHGVVPVSPLRHGDGQTSTTSSPASRAWA